jgi:serine/threonine protein kinase
MPELIHGQLIAGNRLSLSLFQEKGMELSCCEESSVSILAWAQEFLYIPVEVDNGLVRRKVMVHIEDAVDKLSRHGLDPAWVRSQIIGHHFTDVVLKAKAKDLVDLCLVRYFQALDLVQVEEALKILESSYDNVDQQFKRFKIVRRDSKAYLELDNGNQIDLFTLKLRPRTQSFSSTLSRDSSRSFSLSDSLSDSDSNISTFAIGSGLSSDEVTSKVKLGAQFLARSFAPFIAIQSGQLEGPLKWALATSVAHHTGIHSRKFKVKGGPSVNVEIRDARIAFIIKGYRYEVDQASLVVNADRLKSNGLTEGEVLKIQEYVRNLNWGVSRIEDSFSLAGRRITRLSSGGLILHTDETLGKGSFKTVEKVVDLISGKVGAFYLTTLTRATLGEAVLAKQGNAEEIVLMERFKNQGQVGVIQLKGRTKEVVGADGRSEVGVSMPYYDLGSLETFASSYSLDAKDGMVIINQLAKALQGLHQQGLVHRDIKPANIFIKSSKSQKFKAILGDVGFLTSIDDNDKKQKLAGTPFYLSPEYARAIYRHSLGSKVDFNRIDYKACDVWALGLTFYQMMYAGALPPEIELIGTSSKTPDDFVSQLGFLVFPVTFPVDHPFNQILSHMLTSRDRRWTMDQVVEALASYRSA